MKVIDIVNQLISQGHKVKYRVRKDGGIIVTRVDNKKFTRAGTGNKYVRELSGVTLSEARRVQTSYNVKKFIQLGKNNPKKATSKGDPEDLKKLTRKVQREWRKKKTIGEGKVTIRKVRWLKEHKGEEEARLYLERRLQYSRGIAYDENVETWASRIEQIGVGTPEAEEARAIADLLRSKKGQVLERQLEAIHEIEYSSGKTTRQKLQEIRKIVESI